jgi:hypothetical protein
LLVVPVVTLAIVLLVGWPPILIFSPVLLFAALFAVRSAWVSRPADEMALDAESNTVQVLVGGAARTFPVPAISRVMSFRGLQYVGVRGDTGNWLGHREYLIGLFDDDLASFSEALRECGVRMGAEPYLLKA